MTLGCIGAFGSGPFGSTPFGSGSALAVLSARQDSLNSVAVVFTTPPLAGDPGNVTDALNPANWTIAPLNPPTSHPRFAQTCVLLDTATVRVYFDGRLDPFVVYRITASPSIVAAGGGAISAACAIYDVATMGWPRLPLPEAARDGALIDIANPFTETDSPSPGGALGTFQRADTGDLANDAERTNLRKRVFRRLTTAASGFFHLPGYGVAPKLKSLAIADELRRTQSNALAQIKQEPDVLSATVEVSVPTPGIVRLVATVKDRYGKVETVTADVPRPS